MEGERLNRSHHSGVANVRPPAARVPARSGALLLAVLLAALGAGSGLAPAARADDAAIQQEIDALKQRIEALERQLAESKKAPAPPPAVDADALKARNSSRFQVGGYAQLRFT